MSQQISRTFFFVPSAVASFCSSPTHMHLHLSCNAHNRWKKHSKHSNKKITGWASVWTHPAKRTKTSSKKRHKDITFFVSMWKTHPPSTLVHLSLFQATAASNFFCGSSVNWTSKLFSSKTSFIFLSYSWNAITSAVSCTVKQTNKK